MTVGGDGGMKGLFSLDQLKDMIEQFDEVVEHIIAVDSSVWDHEDAMQVYASLETSRKKLGIADAAFLHGNEMRLPDTRTKQRNVLMREAKLCAAEARERIIASERLDNRPNGVSPGGVRKKYMPELRKAVEEGVANTEAVANIGAAIENTPSECHDVLTKIADKPLTDAIRAAGPAVTKDVSNSLKQIMHAYGIEASYKEKDIQRKRGITLGTAGDDGMSKINGTVTPRMAAVMRKLFADWAKAGDLLSRKGSDGKELTRKELAQKDRRNPSQRRHDALEAALFSGFGPQEQQEFLRGLTPEDWEGINGLGEPRDADGLSGIDGLDDTEDTNNDSGCRTCDEEDGPCPPLLPRDLHPSRGATTIVATMTLEQLLSQRGTGMTDTGTLMPVKQLIESTLLENFYLQILDLEGQTLWLGRSARLGTLSQYLALLGEEGGSTAPGSSTPAAWCHMHHIDGWERGGPTDIDNLTLVDPGNHARIDDSRRNPHRPWTLRTDGTTGEKVIWIPPEGKDPERKPHANDNPTVWGNQGPTLRRRARDTHSQPHVEK